MKNVFLILFILFYGLSYGQREIIAHKRMQNIILDGILDETDWKASQWSTGFTQMRPYPGASPSKKTEVALLYDQEAIYIGIKCFDDPDSVSRVLSIRDDFNPNLVKLALLTSQVVEKSQ